MLDEVRDTGNNQQTTSTVRTLGAAVKDQVYEVLRVIYADGTSKIWTNKETAKFIAGRKPNREDFMDIT